MSEHNRAIRQAQRLILHMSERLPQVELGYNQWGQDPRVKGYREAASFLEALLEPEDDHDSTD